MRIVQPGWLARRLAVDQAGRTEGIELRHPVADDLQRHTPDPGRCAPRCTIIDCRKRQQPTRLRSVLATSSRSQQRRRVKIRP